jgi:hypothetical protein
MSVYCGDGEPVAYRRETRRTARKRHECCACEIPILPGHGYWVIASCWDGRVHSWKRCLRCQIIHDALVPLCSINDEWPDEELNCGHTFEENYDRPPPEWLASLAFWQPGDPLPSVNPCTEIGRWDYVRSIVYRPLHMQQGGMPRADNASHQEACS